MCRSREFAELFSPSAPALLPHILSLACAFHRLFNDAANSCETLSLIASLLKRARRRRAASIDIGSRKSADNQESERHFSDANCVCNFKKENCERPRERWKREKEMHVTIFNALATFISSFNAKNFLSFAANVGCGNFLCAPSFLRQRASFFIVSQHSHTHSHM